MSKDDDISAEQTSEPPDYRLYTPHQIFVASIVGSAAAGLWLIAANSRAVDGRELTWRHGVFVVAVAVVVLSSPCWAPLMIEPGMLLNVGELWIGAVGLGAGLSCAIGFVGGKSQTRRTNEHRRRGGAMYSNWRVGKLVAACAMLFVIMPSVGWWLMAGLAIMAV